MSPISPLFRLRRAIPALAAFLLIVSGSRAHAAAPVVTSALAAAGQAGAAFSYQITADNSPTSFDATGLPAGLSVDANSGVISGTPASAGTSSVVISATNADGTGTATLVLTIDPATPVVTSALAASGQAGAAFSYQIAATNSPTSFDATGLPAGLSVNTANGVISGTPSSAGTSNVVISATNAGGTGTATVVLTVDPATPVVTSELAASGQAGAAFSYQIAATNSPTSFDATGLPAGLSVNTTDGVISGTPSTAGTSNVVISATNAGGTGTATLVLTIDPATPVVTSALAASGQAGAAFSYQIAATNSPTSFDAAGLPAGLAINTTNGVISGTPSSAGTSNVVISATNAGGTGTATMVLTVDPATPVVTSALAATGQVSAAFSYQIAATHSPTSFDAAGLPAGLAINTTNGVISGTPSSAGTSNIVISAANAGGTGTATMVLTINPEAPVITSALTATGQVGAAFSYQIAATHSPASFNASNLPAGLSVNTSNGVISGTPSSAVARSVVVSATNAGGTGTATMVLTINPATPVVTSAPAATGQVGVAFSYQIAATHSPTSFNASNLPAGLSVNTSNGVISGTPSSAVTRSVVVSATNAGGTGTATVVLTINPPTPVVTSAPAASGQVGVAFSYQISATNTPASFSASNLPAGLSVNAANGVISGTPSSAVTRSVVIGATNAGGTGTATVVMTIIPAAPVITSALAASGQAGVAFSYQIAATNSPASFSASNLPAGLSVNTANGVISGTPSSAGTGNIVISATNAGGTGTATLVLAVDPPTPVITSVLSASGQAGTAFSYQITAANFPTTFNAVNLPAGLSVDTANGVISGTPSSAVTRSVAISATNSGGTGTAVLVLAINPATPVITSTLAATGQAGTEFSYRIRATNSPTSFDASGLPAGLSVNTSNGVISGTPSSAGGGGVVVSATNAGGTGTAVLLLTVNPPTPVITSALTASGRAGTAFSYRIVAANSPTSFNAVNLPAGLAIDASNGVISGTPSSAVTRNVTISAANAGGTDTAVLVLSISPPMPVITSALSAYGKAGAGFLYQITVATAATSFNAVNLPAGLGVNTSNGVIAGTATVAGTKDVLLSATNAGGTVTAVLVLTMAPFGAPNLDGVRVYPVPFKPAGGDPAEGKPYSAGDPASGIIFDNLPAAVTLTIYTLSGRQAARLEASAGTGVLRWDARSADGREAASGGYLAVISSPGLKSVVKRLLIIR